MLSPFFVAGAEDCLKEIDTGGGERQFATKAARMDCLVMKR